MTILFGILAGLISFAIGGAWYGIIFRDAWIIASGIDMAKIEADRQAGNKGQKEMVLSLLFEILTAIIAVFFIKSLGISPLYAASLMGLLSALASVKNYLFEQRPIQLILINETYKVICFLIAGLFALMA
ncbi:DUF1761 domain-containing protein [Streptococcus plurextorum]|uniref:DUF1761 domain-containing protein n=1 Tax=Streptococcus plurextorum TaxID=456876 RepID=UPI0003FB5D5D|nr:DUF1761 domain-containing protein [Streptococcus plurextorum]